MQQTSEGDACVYMVRLLRMAHAISPGYRYSDGRLENSEFKKKFGGRCVIMKSNG